MDKTFQQNKTFRGEHLSGQHLSPGHNLSANKTYRQDLKPSARLGRAKHGGDPCTGRNTQGGVYIFSADGVGPTDRFCSPKG
jgi:hypothetical protein